MKKNNTQHVVVGIDFGTTNSLVAISKDGVATIIPDGNGNLFVPSVLELRNDKEVVVVNSIKRLFGKSILEIQNSAISDEIKKCLVNKNGISMRPYMLLTHTATIGAESVSMPIIVDFTCDKTITELASYIFKALKDRAEKFLNTVVTRAVVTVPAYFDDNARGMVCQSAAEAGIEVLRLINEPTAAAYAYGVGCVDEGDNDKLYVVYDLGGGTFDVSVLKVSDGVFRVIATGGDNNLGGDDIDHALANYIYNTNKASKHLCDSNNFAYYLQIARRIKEELSYSDNVVYNNYEVNINEYNVVINNIIDKTIAVVRNTLFRGGCFDVLTQRAINVDAVILAGGASRIPLIHHKLAQIFDPHMIHAHHNPDIVVVQGAAMQAENLVYQNNSLIIDVTPLSIGIELIGGVIETIIPRNTPIPAMVKHRYTTYADYQTGIKFHIVQGEGDDVSKCRSLGMLEIKGLVQQKAGQSKVEITFLIDASGLMYVSALNCDTRQKHDIELKPSYGLTTQAIQELMLKSDVCIT